MPKEKSKKYRSLLIFTALIVFSLTCFILIRDALASIDALPRESVLASEDILEEESPDERINAEIYDENKESETVTEQENDLLHSTPETEETEPVMQEDEPAPDEKPDDETVTDEPASASETTEEESSDISRDSIDEWIPGTPEYTESSEEGLFLRFSAIAGQYREKETISVANTLSNAALPLFEYEEVTAGYDDTEIEEVLLAPRLFYANTPETVRVEESVTDEDNDGLNAVKFASANSDGSYTITLEQWTEGTTTKISEPLDIVMTLDVSSSMNNYYYTPVYAGDLDTSKRYYVSGYTQLARYCETCGTWDSWYIGDTVEHTWPHSWYQTWVTPKQSSSDKTSGRVTFYERRQIDSAEKLKVAAKEFIDLVQQNAIETGLNHRITIIKFRDDITDKIGNTQYYLELYQTYVNYTQVVMDYTDVATGADALKNAVDSLECAGMTRTDNALTLTKSQMDKARDKSNKIAIIFTDGNPEKEGTSGVWNDRANVAIADDAISTSKQMKDDGVSVYTIGLKTTADGSVPMKESSEKFNYFLHYISSNFKNALSMTSPGDPTYSDDGGSYYLSTTTSKGLSEIFENLARKITSSDISLKAETLIRDVVTKYFDVTAGSIRTFTSEWDGTRFSDERNEIGLTAQTTLNRDNTTTIEISGYDFDQNYIKSRDSGEDDLGRKLIIQFEITPKDEFLGGNAVPTNTEESGIYSNLEGEETAEDLYKVPEVNVPIQETGISTGDINTYITDNVGMQDITNITKLWYTSRYSGQVYELKTDHGIVTDTGSADDFVNISYSIKDADGNEVKDETYKSIKNDSAFSVSIKTEPMNEAAQVSVNTLREPNRNPGRAAVPSEKTRNGGIYVFVPVATFRDQTVKFGQEAPDDLFYMSYDYVDTSTYYFNNAKGKASENTMTGFEPTLSCTFSPAEGTIINGRVYTTDDIPVTVDVLANGEDICDYIKISHLDCGEDGSVMVDGCTWDEQDSANNVRFLLHVKATYSLPSTGGSGTATTYICGADLILLALLMLVIKKKEKRNKLK